WRGQGIGRALLRWSEYRARELAGVQARPDEAAEYAANASDTEPEAAGLLEREGYVIAERWAAMALEPIAPRPEPALPAGIAIRPLAAESMPAIWAAYTDVYAERWVDAEPTEREFQGFRARFLD